MLVRSENVSEICVRLNDATGQCHQNKNVLITGDGKWHELVIEPTDIAGGEHWGGANDGKWHGPATLVALLWTATLRAEGWIVKDGKACGRTRRSSWRFRPRANPDSTTA